MLRSLRLILLFLAAPALAGCGTYAVRGHVIEGSVSTMAIVESDDPRLNESGVRDVQISVFRDPGRLDQSLAGTGVSASDGSINIALDEFGAGWMDELWMLHARRSGYANASETLKLPTNWKSRRLLIILAPGRSMPEAQRDDLWEEYRRYR